MRIVRSSAAGFTLTELVVVIAISGILAAFAISRINTQSFDTEGFANRATAMVRYAQRLAVNQRRTVAVVVSGNTLSLCYVDTACTGGPVAEPPGTSAFAYTAPSGVTLAGTSFTFSALGKPNAGGSFTVTGDVTRTITIEAETGYVH